MFDDARLHARVTRDPLNLGLLGELVRHPRAGAVVVFSGETREVDHLNYEAYAEMAEERILAIVHDALAEHGLCSAAAEHRLGVVPISTPSVIVAASAPHREAAFAGARMLIDRIKAEAPVWKQELGSWKHEAVPPTPPPRRAPDAPSG